MDMGASCRVSEAVKCDAVDADEGAAEATCARIGGVHAHL